MLLTKLRKDLQFNGELLSLVDTLKNIAAAQYHQMEKEKERFDLFLDSFYDFFRVVNLVQVKNPLVRVESDTAGVVMVTSDSGFMGGLNQSVLRAGLAAVENPPPDKVSLVVVGDKGAGVFHEQQRPFKYFEGLGTTQDEIYRRAVQVKDYIVQEVLEHRMGRVVISYPRALSFTAQTNETINLLPCAELFDSEVDSDVTHHTRLSRFLADAQTLVLESSPDDLLEYLASEWVTTKLFEVFEDSKLAEFSARAMHLEDSVQKVEKEHKKLKQMCFKASHEAIDKGMREGFAAKSLKKKTKKASAARSG